MKKFEDFLDEKGVKFTGVDVNVVILDKFANLFACEIRNQALEEAANIAQYHYADILEIRKYTKAGICQSVAEAIREEIK
jgi:hypothetical protein